MFKRITTIYGDGIGPEVTQQSVKVLQTVAEVFGHEFFFQKAMLGAEAIDATGLPLPPETLDMALQSDAILFGAIGHPKYDNDPVAEVRPEQGLLGLRKALDLFANIRPVKTVPALRHLSPLKNIGNQPVDLVIYRELTGGIYFGHKETDADKTMATDTCTYHKSEIERIAKLAFEAAASRRRKLTLIDKANVLETSRLWRHVVQNLAKEYTEVKVDYMHVDNAAMQLIINPWQFDVILTENLFGDILSDEASVLSGSLGLMPSASIGQRGALFEPIHGSYHQAAGKDIANPVGAILSAALMLRHFAMHDEANIVEEAVQWTLQNGFVTKDIDPVNFYFTATVGDLVCDYIQGKIVEIVNKNNIELRKSTII
ncbi:MAG TPA: 3-isopropylmalate dehydrogenase [Phnomibacter sp.]|nr:3-isopropylmalate dehydrogenase [Phnomibacter sp.]